VARNRSLNLTEGELRLMKVLWERQRASVGEVAESVGGKPRPAYNTVLTMLRILERKGYVRHIKEGRAFIYEPIVGKKQASTSALKHLLSRFFGGSAEALVLNLLEHDQIDAQELERIKAMLRQSERSRPRGE
jgi:predicted transcriptional regulator